MLRSRRLLCAWTVFAACACPGVATVVAGDAPPVVIRGTERLFWDQAGDTESLEFRIHVDGVPGETSAACERVGDELTCSAPLPFIAEGVHALTITAISRTSGLESPPSEPITVLKIPTAPPSELEARARRRPTPTAAANAAAGASTTEAARGTLDVSVVTRRLKAPADVASTGDGRFLVSEADGIIRILDGSGTPGTIAFDAHESLRRTPGGPLGITVAPDFARSRWAVIAFVASDADDDPMLEIVRVREAAGILGEQATLFEIPLVSVGDEPPVDAPQLAFGPDGLLYIALPSGLLFDALPTASAPSPTFARVALDGRPLADVSPLQGVTSHVRGFDWDASTGELWGVLDADGTLALTRLSANANDDGRAAGHTLALGEPAGTRAAGSLVIAPSATASTGSIAYALTHARDLVDVIHLGAELAREGRLDSGAGRLGRLVAGPDGSLIALTRTIDWVAGAEGTDTLLRLTPPPPRQ